MEGERTAYDVVVVGLGPTGLLLTHLLARRGLSVLALEQEPTFYGMARAVYTDDEVLRILQGAGVADEVHAQMITDVPVRWVRKDRSVLAQFENLARPQGWPISNFLYQPTFENALEQRLADLPSVTVRRGRAVVGFAQSDTGVRVTHAASTGTEYGRRAPALVDGSQESDVASYLVGADGGRSIVRTLLDIELEGRAFPQRWLVIDLKARAGADPFRALSGFDFVCDPQRPIVSCPQPDGRHRFEFMLHDDEEASDFESPELARRLMADWIDPDAVVIERQLVYAFKALVAKQWRRGRVFLAGDAAHLSPQFIGQGMNAGLRDADNLSWKLWSVLRQGADASILDTYESERRPHARAMINLSVFNKDLVSTGDRRAILAREVGLRAALRTPMLKTYISEARMKPKPRLRRGAYVGMPRDRRGGPEGDLLPQPLVADGAGRQMRLDELLGVGWAAVGVDVEPDVVLRDARWSALELTSVRVATRATSGADWRTWLRRSRIRSGSVLLLRPDKFVFAVVTKANETTVLAALRPVMQGAPLGRMSA